MQTDTSHPSTRSASVLTVTLVLLAAATMVLAGLKWQRDDESVVQTPREIAQQFMTELDRENHTESSASTKRPQFTDVATDMGLIFHHDNAARGEYFLPEEMGPGCGFLDYDNDGDLDVFIAGGGALVEGGPIQTCRLFRNDLETGRVGFTDVTEQSGAGIPGPAYGVVCADFDNDGDIDIFITRLGKNAMLLNDGNGHFQNVAATIGLADDHFGAGATFFDYDRDGWLDLYVTNYVDWSVARETVCYSILGQRDYCNPVIYQSPGQDRLYRNRGDGTFEDVTRSAGIESVRGNGLGVVACDFDNDGWVDLYVANDQTPGMLWHNRGDGTFENIAELIGAAYDDRGVSIAGMGVACADFNGDGEFDLFITNIRSQTHLVLENRGAFFIDRSRALGLGKWSIPTTGFGVAVFDQNHDGRLDVYIANGAVNKAGGTGGIPGSVNPFGQKDQFARYMNGKFIDHSDQSGVVFDDVGRGLARGDFDNDGDLDLLLTNNDGPVRLLRNNCDEKHSWLIVDAQLDGSNRSALGARIEVTADDVTQRRTIRRQDSYLSSSDSRAHFGLGEVETVEYVTIRWPDGTETQLHQVAVNQILRVTHDGRKAAGANE